ncbi:MAG: type II toxin-antitoxin system RelE/ParE family toxin [Terracidiphilus sp.]
MSVERKVAYPGTTYRIAFARDHSGVSPAEAFYDGLPLDEKAQLLKLFQILGDETRGVPRNPKKFGVLDHELYEFKSFQIRMPFAYAKGDRGLVLISHGFRKKKDKTPPSEIAKAKKILQEDAETSKVCIITDHQKRKRP